MTTTTLSRARNRHSGQGRLVSLQPSGENGFTLVELMIGASLASFILAGVLSTFLFMGRSGANVQNYNDMESQARNALEYFAEDTRQASGVVWGSDSNTMTLTVSGSPVMYTYNPTARTFSRRDGTSTRVLVTGITSFSFTAYNISGNNVLLDTAAQRTAANGTTKQLQISLEAARNTQTVVAATNTVLSARFVLRNKRVTA
jgi:Tfp pilus assembly protein PilW